MASSQFSISSSPTYFLDIVFNTLGHIIMNDRLNVRFVDTHTKSDSANKTSNLVVNK